MVLRNTYGCIPILFPKDHRDVSTSELGRKLCLHQPFRKRNRKQSGCPVRKKQQKHFWLQLQALVSHSPHQAGQVWEARAPNPGALLESIQFDCCHRNGLKHGVLAILPPPHCSLCPYPQKLMGSAHFCNLYSLGSDMTCVFLH